MQDTRVNRNGVVHQVSRNDHPQVKKVLYHMHCSNQYMFEMSTDEWDALPEAR